MVAMDDTNICLDTSVLIAYLKGRESGATAVEQAAICLEHSLPLLTLNERHFSRVPDLQVLTPDTFLS